MCYLMFALVMELEQFIFEKCSFDQPPVSCPSPLWALDKPSPSSKSTYSRTTCWLQQSQNNIDHFWKKDMALVKALRQYPLCFQHFRMAEPSGSSKSHGYCIRC